jgi:hypothetical protein
MSTLKKLAVLSILIVSLVAFSLPASAADAPVMAGANNNVAPADAAKPAAADATAPAAAPVDTAAMPAATTGMPVGTTAAPLGSATSGLSAIPNTVLPGGAIAGTAIGGAGFGPFGGIGFPFNLGYNQFGIGAYPFNWGLGGGWGPLGMNFKQFSPCFGGGCGGGFFSPCFLGGCGMLQAVPFITGCGLGGVAGPGWQLAPWAFGLGGCQQAAPLYFGAHGFGFPFTIGNIGWSLVPPIC